MKLICRAVKSAADVEPCKAGRVAHFVVKFAQIYPQHAAALQDNPPMSRWASPLTSSLRAFVSSGDDRQNAAALADG